MELVDPAKFDELKAEYAMREYSPHTLLLPKRATDSAESRQESLVTALQSAMRALQEYARSSPPPPPSGPKPGPRSRGLPVVTAESSSVGDHDMGAFGAGTELYKRVSDIETAVLLAVAERN